MSARPEDALERLRGDWEPRFRKFVAEQPDADPGHGPAHLERVVATAVRLAAEEGARLDIVLPAAWLHDCVHVAKNSPGRANASRLSADHALRFLEGAGYAAGCLPDIRHAIEAHSYSAGITPRTVEARVVQDADRLDALGAIGLARCLAVGTALGRPLYAPADPFCRARVPDDQGASVDHFYAKLLRLAGTMQTAAGRREAARRTAFLEAFLGQLESEIAP
ncbi:MAG TPA: HD domain-containing protein [Steroidobacteraceae bacterium]|nr:HD domain-containing protein [Steroidobacteraceae bacterium]